jgi:hypothetical protein
MPVDRVISRQGIWSEDRKIVQPGYGDVWLFIWIIPVDGYSGYE